MQDDPLKDITFEEWRVAAGYRGLPCPYPSSLFPSKALFCISERCAEDGVCRRQGVDLISPCTTD